MGWRCPRRYWVTFVKKFKWKKERICIYERRKGHRLSWGKKVGNVRRLKKLRGKVCNREVCVEKRWKDKFKREREKLWSELKGEKKEREKQKRRKRKCKKEKVFDVDYYLQCDNNVLTPNIWTKFATYINSIHTIRLPE